MKHIVARQRTVTVLPQDLEPSDTELKAIEVELPLILAERDLLDALIAQLDRPASEFDARRIRRARNRVLAARRCLANRAAGSSMPGDAA
ncbi:hypothetical protein A6A28_07925 [Streptomyces sp. CB03578]|uniref:DUF6284 family protein n=1 Tax=Streptomyces sp. CB03578 TaxID=1718987 RepID=UPI00093C7B0F|nr:DUF6284 family protein [Streptomyces sp. CB03578]OKI33819.1 hypothetical protein A6A28_07925 [Streptomyces sp. CB03578]